MLKTVVKSMTMKAMTLYDTFFQDIMNIVKCVIQNIVIKKQEYMRRHTGIHHLYYSKYR